MIYPHSLVLNLFTHSYELVHSLKSRQRPRIVIDSSIILASLLHGSKEINRVLNLRKLFDLVSALEIELLIPSAVLYDLWAAFAESR